MLVSNDIAGKILKQLSKQKLIFLDIETTGLKVRDEDFIVGIGIGTSAKKFYYFPFRHKEGNLDSVHLSKLIEILNGVKYIIAHNIKFDLAGLEGDGLIVSDQVLIDTLIMGRLCSRERHAKLDLVSLYRNFIDGGSEDNKAKLKEYKRINKIKDKGVSSIDPHYISSYCESDLRQLYELYFFLHKQIRSTNQEKIYQLEVDTTKTLFFMEQYGAKIDPEYCNRTKLELDESIKETESRIYEITKEKQEEPVNVLSNLQLGKIFNAFGINSLLKTPTGKECWDEKALLLIDHPLIGLVKEYRTLRKLRDTYFTPFLEKEIIHSSFKNWGTVTGRLSSGDPNLQNIPRYQKSLSGKEEKMDEEKRKRILAMASLRKTAGGSAAGGSSLSSWGFTGDEKYVDSEELVSVRRLFIARPHYILYSFDFSQMEIRIFVSYLNNEKIFEEMKDDKFDFHSFVAKIVFGYDSSHPDFKFWRQIAKAITFGLIYGMGNDLLAGQMGKSVTEAAEFRKIYFAKLKGAREFIKVVNKKITERGFVFNRYGRKYYIEPNKSYVGVNYLVQGTSGDLVKDRMNYVFRFLQDKKSRLINQIHDELLIEIHEDEQESIVPQIVSILEENRFSIPLKVDKSKCFPSWAHKLES